jgi:cytochrome bd-type quinol oxidase subunit 2
MAAPRATTILTLPLVLLTVSLLENVLTYKLRQHVHNVYWRTALSLVLYGSALTLASAWLSPAVKNVFVGVRRASRQNAGTTGVWLFFAAAYGLLYWAYLTLERGGPAALLPVAWR